jgi:peptidoglycan/LPS O-acetylase OafA/YrhL
MSTHHGANRAANFVIPSLDGLRAIAVLTVFVGHGLTAPGAWPGHVGVTIFFFLSGYLITTLLRREYEKTQTIALKRFYLRRAFRILPAAYTAITVAVILANVGSLGGAVTGWGILAEVFSYTNYYIVAFGRDGLPPATTQFWSLGVEEHYYLAIPLVIWLLLARGFSRERIGILLLSLAALVPIWRIYLGLTGASFDRLYISTDTRMDSILFGSAFALLMNPALGDLPPRGPRVTRILNEPWLALVATGVFVASALVPGQHFRLSVADVVQCACLVPIFWHLIQRPTSHVGRVLNHKIVARIGVLSFSVYLFHRMVIELLAQSFAAPIFIDIFALVLTIGVAELVYRTVEKPSIALRRNIEHRLDRRRQDRLTD